MFTLNSDHLPGIFKHENVTVAADEYILRANLKTESHITEWITAFSTATKTQWIVKRTRPTLDGGRTLFKEYVCHHSSFKKVPKNNEGCNKRGISKNASCEARIRISINIIGSKRSRDQYVRIGLAAKIRISREHTHTLYSGKTLRFLQCKDGTVRDTFFEYFDDTMIASEAKKFHEHKLSLRNCGEEDFANGSINPTIETVAYWFQQWRQKNLGPRSGQQLISKLKEKQMLYAEKGIILKFTEKPFCVLLETPLMQRAHTLVTAGELLFVDSTSACDAGQHCVTFLLTPCAAGAVPLAVLITSGQSKEVYSKGFQLTNTIPGQFGNRGYPKIVLTDNSAAEIGAINETWPHSINLLCTFHILQAVWRWLWDSTNGIGNEHRVILMNSFKSILYSSNLIEMEHAYLNCLKIGSELKYDKWVRYAEEYYKFKERWVLAYRDETVRGHHTNNFSETSIRIFKDIVLCRVKAYNVIALTDFCVTSLEEYYIAKLRTFANFRNRLSFNFFRKHLRKIMYLTKDDITRIDDEQLIFLVPSQSDPALCYTVYCEVGSCTCPDGKYGKFCKHQCAVYQFFQVRPMNFPLISPKDRYEMAKLALGADAPPASFYEEFEIPFNEKISSESTSEQPVNVQDARDVSNGLLPQSSQPPVPAPFQDVTNTFDSNLPILCMPEEPVTSPKNNNSEVAVSLFEEKNALITFIKNQFEEKVNSYPVSTDVVNALKMYSKHLNRITTEGLLLKFLHACPATLRRFRSGTKISVQPTSISRRKVGMTRGCKKIASGRIPKGNPASSKRPHQISRAILENTRL